MKVLNVVSKRRYSFSATVSSGFNVQFDMAQDTNNKNYYANVTLFNLNSTFDGTKLFMFGLVSVFHSISTFVAVEVQS